MEALAAGRPPTPPLPIGKAGEPSIAPADATVTAAMARRIKALDAALSAHELPLQARAEMLEAHAL